MVYGIKSIDPITGAQEYTVSNDLSTWFNISYKHEALRYGIFAGYAKNLGLNDNLVSATTYGRNLNIAQTYRISPSIAWTNQCFMLVLEPEMTTAYYGTMVLNDHGKVKDASAVTDYRIELTARYTF